jgi:hypothetical protein
MSEGTGPAGQPSTGIGPVGQQYTPMPLGGQHGGTRNQNVNISGTGNQVAGRDIKTKHVSRNGRLVPFIGNLSIGGKVVIGTLVAAAALGTGIAVHSATSGSGGSDVVVLPDSVEGFARVTNPADADSPSAGFTVSSLEATGLSHPQLGEYGQQYTGSTNYGWVVAIGGNTATFIRNEQPLTNGDSIDSGFGGSEYCTDSDGENPANCVWWNTTSVIIVIGPTGDDGAQVAPILARIHNGTEK